jgi:type IV pilus assembly protein PilV
MNNSSAGRMRSARPRSTVTAQSGVGLIEVLIAVLVLSIAFLGIAALQAVSLSTNNSAMARSMATIASYSILDAMRADIGGARSGAYNTSTPIAANACPAASGSLASFQLNRWCSDELGNKSLGAVASTTGKIACTAAGTASAECTVTITFDDSRTGAGGSSSQQVITKAML